MKFKNRTIMEISLNHNLKRSKSSLSKMDQNIQVYSLGQWLKAERHGFGIQLWPDGAKYEGEWQNNKANGRGKFWHLDGDIYDGNWVNDKANGFGVYSHKNGARYEGNWVDDTQEGEGSLIQEQNIGQMDQNIQGNTGKEKRKEKVNIYGPMDQDTSDIGKIIK